MNNNCECKNNYNDNTFMESFGKDDDEIRKCDSCPNMEFVDGMMTCTKFNKR